MSPNNYDYISDWEDNPRRVLDTDGDFTVINFEPPITFKLRDFNPMMEDGNGNIVPYDGVISVRPLPPPRWSSVLEQLWETAQTACRLAQSSLRPG